MLCKDLATYSAFNPSFKGFLEWLLLFESTLANTEVLYLPQSLNDLSLPCRNVAIPCIFPSSVTISTLTFLWKMAKKNSYHHNLESTVENTFFFRKYYLKSAFMNAIKQNTEDKQIKCWDVLLHVDTEQRITYIMTAHKKSAVQQHGFPTNLITCFCLLLSPLNWTLWIIHEGYFNGIIFSCKRWH